MPGDLREEFVTILSPPEDEAAVFGLTGGLKGKVRA
jgi:hypothetical protein